MQCPSCKEEVPQYSRFCLLCGTPLPATNDSTAPKISNDDVDPSLPISQDFVGRRSELDQLVSALDSAISGQGRIVMLVGEPGIGKTRTAQELAEVAEQRGAQVWWGPCYEGDGAPPYWPWIQPIKSYVQQLNHDQLLPELGEGASDIAELIPEIRNKLPEISPPVALDPQQARFRLFASITTFLTNTSNRKPIVLVLDDLHWSDRPSLLMLEFLAKELTNSRILIVGTYRDIEVSRRHPLSETLARLSRQSVFSRMVFRGLSQNETAELVEANASIRPSEQILDLLYTSTEGNPFFTSEVIRLLRDQGKLEEVASVDPENIRMPEGVRDVLGQRLNALTDECNQLLSVASVIGREFDFELLNAISGMSDDEVLDLIDEAMDAHVIEELQGAEERYQFSHALMRQTLEEELSTSRRRRIHSRVAEALEKLHGADIEGAVNELAHHLIEAEVAANPDKVAEYSKLAGEQALASYAYEDAITHFERVLESKGGQVIDLETAEVLYGLGISRAANNQIEEALDSFSGAFDYFARTGEIEKAIAVPSYPLALYENRALTNLLERALELVTPNSLEAGRILSLHGVSLALAMNDYHSARVAFNGSLEIARRHGDVSLKMWTLGRQGWIENMNVNCGYGLELLKESVALSDITGDLEANVHGHFNMIYGSMTQGDLDEAEQHVADCIESARKTRIPYRAVMAGFAAQSVPFLKGDWVSARMLNDSLIELVGNSTCAPHNFRCVLEYETGDFERAEGFLKQTINMATEKVVWRQDLGLAAAIIKAFQLTGKDEHLELAEATLDSVVTSTETQPFDVLDARIGLSWLAILKRNPERASEQYSILSKVDQPACGTIGACSVVYSLQRILGLLAQTIGNQKDAEYHFDEALAFCQRAGYRPELAWTCYDYANMLFELDESGDTSKAQTLTEESLDLSTELGMRPLKERVQKLKMVYTTANANTYLTGTPTAFSERTAISTHVAPDGTVTIMFTDIQDSTPITQRLGDIKSEEWVGTHNSITRRHVAANGGYEVRYQGDGFLLTFSRSSDALKCAIDIQRELETYSRENPDAPLLVRMGLHTGEIIKVGDDLHGVSVILAARISAEAKGGQVIVSDLLKKLVESRREFEFENEQQLDLKGLEGLHTVYDLVWWDKSMPPSYADSTKTLSFNQNLNESPEETGESSDVVDT